MMFSDAVVLDTYTLVVGAIALVILGVLVGLVGSPWWERRVQRGIAMKRLGQPHESDIAAFHADRDALRRDYQSAARDIYRDLP